MAAGAAPADRNTTIAAGTSGRDFIVGPSIIPGVRPIVFGGDVDEPRSRQARSPVGARTAKGPSARHGVRELGSAGNDFHGVQRGGSLMSDRVSVSSTTFLVDRGSTSTPHGHFVSAGYPVWYGWSSTR